MPIRRTSVVLLLNAATLCAQPQTSVKTPPAPTGFVSGLVTCADTNSPARFATVIPIPIPSKDPGALAETPVIKSRNIAKTDITGHYILQQLPPGDYVIIAELDGYVTPVADISLQKILQHDAAAIKILTDRMPVTHITTGKGASTNLTLQRGAIIYGTVTYNDGTPAIEAEIDLQPASSTSDEYIPTTGLGLDSRPKTDSFGRFSIQGLAEGHYILRARMNSSQDLSNILSDDFSSSHDPYTFLDNVDQLAIYSPNTFHRNAAAVCDLKQGERQQVDIEIPLDDLHTLAGVIRADPTQPPPIFGMISAVFDGDTDLERNTTVHADGSFRFTYMPAGKYKLIVRHLSDLPPKSSRDKTSEQKEFDYPPAGSSADITKSDVTDIVIAIPSKPPAKTSVPPTP